MPTAVKEDMPAVKKRKTLEDFILEVDYAFLNKGYKPTQQAIEFITFIKLVNGAQGEENKTPVIHMDMLDNAALNDECLFVSFRGSAKTTALHEYMYLYLATYGEFFDFGEVQVAMYISDTIDNGVKSMRKNLEFRWTNSEFLQEMVPKANFTDVRWEFENVDGHKFVVRGFGASTGVRGFKEYGLRPTWCGYDDLMSDKNAESPTITKDIRNIIYKAARQAMHPKKRKIIWTGTPFNKRDPLYAAAGSKGWFTKVYPICEKFPCTREEFQGAWEDRFSYDFVKKEYDTLLENGEISAFNQELMLRIASDEDRLVPDHAMNWYSRAVLLSNKHQYNFYITTDFATSEDQKADFSVISVWAHNSAGYWFLVDGVCKRQKMDKNVEDLFELAQKYQPQSVGVEISGQQKGFVSWIQKEMMVRNQWFVLAKEKGASEPGIRPNTNKLARFNITVPWFLSNRMFFPKEWRAKHELMIEMEDEITNVTVEGFKSKHDDAADTISMLGVMQAWKPSEVAPKVSIENGDAIFDETGMFDDDSHESALDSYLG